MPNRVIDEMPTRTDVEGATKYQIVCWHHYLRPTMFNEELDIVKAIAMRYDRMPESFRTPLVAQARKEYETH